DPEFNEVAEQFFERVVPRLLRPLQMGGRNIDPVLIHGDLWDGNIEFDKDTDKPIIFDACCCYGHFECEFAPLPLLLRVPFSCKTDRDVSRALDDEYLPIQDEQ
ncbi:fructosamine kinase family protein, partial [Candidatus Bathyarchaeota archaeon]|nr:fructosamine kinase family protein [Candidatus Bathyarchaeota archaeon]